MGTPTFSVLPTAAVLSLTLSIAAASPTLALGAADRERLGDVGPPGNGILFPA